MGIAVCMLIFVVIQFQTSFDDFHFKKDRIYRVLTERYNADDGSIFYDKSIPFPMPGGLKLAFPQLEQVTPVYASHNDELQVLDIDGTPVRKFKEKDGVFYTDPAFFEIFDFPLLAGSYESLKEPGNVLLTKETAGRYFGDWRAAIGRTVKITGYYGIGAGLFQYPPVALKVSGILAAIPANTDFQLKLVVSYGTDFTGDKMYGFQQPDWNGTAPDFGSYVLLPPNMPVEKFNQQLKVYSRKVLPAGNRNSHVLQSLSAVHYDKAVGNFSNKTVSRQLINALWLIAAFIVLIACVNFINLFTAQAVARSKEVGLRKVLGGTRSQLLTQFICETFLIVAGAAALASIMAAIALPWINQWLEFSLSFDVFNNRVLVLFLIAIMVLVTALAGFYPSIVLSGFNPVDALKSKFTVNAHKGISLRRALVVFQFVVAQALIIGTFIIVKQTNYFMSRPPGFDKDAVVNVPFRPDKKDFDLEDYLSQQLLAHGVEAVSFNSGSPMEDDNNLFTTFKFDHSVQDAGFQTISRFVDDAYVPVYKLQLIAGRNLKPSGPTTEFLVNESFVKKLGLKNPADILNKEISIMGGAIKCPVVGVLKDFNDRSLRHGISPLLVTTNATMYRQASIKISTADISATMQAIKKIWEQTFPDYVYEYQFLDDKIAGFYKQESQLSQLYKISASIAIFLSCLGLYGLASFMAVQRIKEVGIRKVLGATGWNIIYLFSKEFVLLVAVAFFIATPLSWYYMQHWLQDYSYRISLDWWLFAAVALLVIVIALFTVSFQAVKAALANPADSLRSE